MGHMDGEQILAYASLANMVGTAIVVLLVWAMKTGRSEGVRASDIAALDRAIHKLANVIDGMPTTASLDNLELRLLLKLKETESTIAAMAAHVASAAAAARQTP